MTRNKTIRGLVLTAVSALAVSLMGTPAHAASCGSTQYADGTVGPAVCANGKPNTAVRGAYRDAAPNIMALKENSTRKQVLAALCADHTAGAMNVQLFDALQYQEARHDWRPRVIRRAERDIVAGRFC